MSLSHRTGRFITSTLTATMALALAAAAALPAQAVAGGSHAASGPRQETKSLERLYHDAIAEGGHLVVYAGGDAPHQNDALAHAFEQQFPKVHLTIDTDLSKYQDARIDNQLTQHRLQPDVAQLQTLQDFDRWKAEGVLLRYKPAGWNAVYSQFKDPGATYVGVMGLAISYLSNNAHVPPNQTPRSALDFLEPQYKGKLTVTYPDDDDAVLYLFKNLVDRYGWSYLDRLMAQKPSFVRGIPASIAAVSTGKSLGTLTGLSQLSSNSSSPTTFAAPDVDFFQSWAQTAAIFRQAAHPAAAKLYLNWLLSKPVQQYGVPQWSVRKDVPAPAGLKPLVDYRNTNPSGFHTFMLNRGAAERFRSQIELYVGTPQGPDPAGRIGLRFRNN